MKPTFLHKPYVLAVFALQLRYFVYPIMDELLLLSIEHDVIRIPLLVYFTPIGLAHFYRKPCNQVTGHECNNAEIAFTL